LIVPLFWVCFEVSNFYQWVYYVCYSTGDRVGGGITLIFGGLGLLGLP